jgi:hypothetical protein
MTLFNRRSTQVSLAIVFPLVWIAAVLVMAAKPSPWFSKKISVDGVAAELTSEQSKSAPK